MSPLISGYLSGLDGYPLRIDVIWTRGTFWHVYYSLWIYHDAEKCILQGIFSAGLGFMNIHDLPENTRHGSTHYHVIWCYFFEVTLAERERDLKDHLQVTGTCIALIVQSHNSNPLQAFCFPLYMFARFPFYKDFSLSTILFSQKINTVTRRSLTYLIISCIHNALKRKWQ